MVNENLVVSPAYRFEMSKNPSGSWPPPIPVSRHPDSTRSENAAGIFRGALKSLWLVEKLFIADQLDDFAH